MLKSNTELCDAEFKKKLCLSPLYKMIIIFKDKNDNNNNILHYQIYTTLELKQNMKLYQYLKII